MLSRSGLSIRKLIAQRGVTDDDFNPDFLVPVPVMGSDQENDSNAYLPNSRFYPKRRAPSPIIATNHLVHSNPFRPLPPVTSETLRSSSALSNRCERHIECDCPLANVKRGSPRYPVQSKEWNEDSTLLSCVNINSPDDTLTYRVPKSRFNSSGNSKSKGEAMPSWSSEEGHKEESSKEESSKDRQSDDESSQELSEDGQNFMQEAEDAFKAIGGTLPEVPLERGTVFNATKPSSMEAPHDLDHAPHTPPKKTSAKFYSQSPSSMTSIIRSISPSNDKSPAPKPRRERSKTFRQSKSMKSQWKSGAPKQAVRSGPRWMLTENVSEYFTGKLFHKIEADEMLTPDQIQEYKQRRMTKVNSEENVEVVDDSSSDFSTEPFPLDDFPSRTRSASIRTDIDMAQQASTLKRQQQAREQRLSFQKNHTTATVSSWPSRPPTRSGTAGLPAIPETRTSPQQDGRLLNSKDSDESLGKVSNSEYVFLQSSPRSMMTPTFQHGPIRLSKADLTPDVRLGGDDALYWTAFQMAILGGAGGWLDDGDDDDDDDDEELDRRRNEAEADDIAEWWESWHFESSGELITQEYEPSSPTSTYSVDDIPDLSHSEFGSDKASPQYRWQESQPTAKPPNLRLNLDFQKEVIRTPSRANSFVDEYNYTTAPWRDEVVSKQTPTTRESVNSLPPSPMLDLRVLSSGNGGEVDIVPMGYNLGHDLGDFLRWEAEHAYAAAGFTSPSRVLN